jgi:phosphatidylglycerol:prolipoprotein diacylglycerol transferase
MLPQPAAAGQSRPVILAAVHPILFEIAGYGVASYGLALVLSFALGIGLAGRRAAARGLDEGRVIEVGIVALVSSLVGARLLWVVSHLDTFRGPGRSWLDALVLAAVGGTGVVGLSIMGGVALAAVASAAYVRWVGMPLLRVADAVTPSLALGVGIGRIGCFLNGCCYGRVCELPWAVRFPEGSPAAALFAGRGVHPTQLYESLAGFVLFALLSWLWRRRLREGTVFFAALVGLAAVRLAIDTLRHHDASTVLFLMLGGSPFTTTSVLCVGMVAVGIAGLVWLRCEFGIVSGTEAAGSGSWRCSGP